MNFPYYSPGCNTGYSQMPSHHPVYQNEMLYPFSVYPYDTIADMDKDISYSKQLYPKAAKRIQAEIEEECDKLEYKDSYMFDETPDRLRLAAIIDRIYERVSAMDFSLSSLKTESMEKNKIAQAICYGPDCKTPPPMPCHGKHCAPPPFPPPPCPGGYCPPPPPPCRGGYCPPPPPPPCRGGYCPPPPPPPCRGGYCPPPRRDYRPDGNPNWLRNLIEIMFYNEMNYRRNRYRQHRRWL